MKKFCVKCANLFRSVRTERLIQFNKAWWSGRLSNEAFERRRSRCITLLYAGRLAWVQCTCQRVTKVERSAAALAPTFVTGRPREYLTNAEKQRAYRERKKLGQ